MNQDIKSLADGFLKGWSKLKSEPIKSNQYRCAMCRGVFDIVRDETWSDEKAMQECAENFGAIAKEHCDTVCDDCYQKIRPDKNPDAVDAYKAEKN